MRIYFGERFPRCASYLVIQNWRSPDSLFGKVDVRKNYTFEQAQRVFKKVWDDGLGEAVKQAPQSSYETVAEQLSDQEQAFLRRDNEHRTVRYRGLTFIAQLVKHDEQAYELDQLWFVHSHDKDNIILCVEFESKEERDRFHEIARLLGHSDGRSMLQAYASNLLTEYQEHKD
jgi:hypothetical protein